MKLIALYSVGGLYPISWGPNRTKKIGLPQVMRNSPADHHAGVNWNMGSSLELQPSHLFSRFGTCQLPQFHWVNSLKRVSFSILWKHTHTHMCTCILTHYWFCFSRELWHTLLLSIRLQILPCSVLPEITVGTGFKPTRRGRKEGEELQLIV